MVSLSRISIFGSRASQWLARVAVAVATLGLSAPVFAQGCAMCYNSAKAAKAAALQALRSGVLILLIPPLLMFIGIFVFAYRNRNKFADDYPENPAADQEMSDFPTRPDSIRANLFEESRPEQHRRVL